MICGHDGNARIIELEGRQLGDKTPAGRDGQALPERIKLEAAETTSSSALIRAGPALVARNYPGITSDGDETREGVVRGRLGDEPAAFVATGTRPAAGDPFSFRSVPSRIIGGRQVGRVRWMDHGSAACHWLRSVRIGSLSCIHRPCTQYSCNQ